MAGPGPGTHRCSQRPFLLPQERTGLELKDLVLESSLEAQCLAELEWPQLSSNMFLRKCSAGQGRGLYNRVCSGRRATQQAHCYWRHPLRQRVSQELGGGSSRSPPLQQQEPCSGYPFTPPKLSSQFIPSTGEVGARPGYSLPTHPSAVALNCCPLPDVWGPMRAGESRWPVTFTCTFMRGGEGPALPLVCVMRAACCRPPHTRTACSAAPLPFSSLPAAPGLNNPKSFDRNLPLLIFLMPVLQIKA